MLDELGPTPPRASLEVVVTERLDARLRLVQPRGIHRGEAGSPPAIAPRPVRRRGASRMAGVPILDQEHPLQVAMAAAECPQLPDVVHSVLAVLGRHLQPPT